MMTAPRFAAIGRLLYGRNWHADMATALNIEPRNIRRMAAGTRSISAGIRDDVTKLCANRINELLGATGEVR